VETVIGMDKLFPKIAFIDDETPVSWASRQAAFHTGGRLVPFLNDLKIPPMDLARGLPEAVQRLCDRAGQDPAPVFRNSISAIGSRRFKLRGFEFSSEFTTGKKTRICPICLAEDLQGGPRQGVQLRHRLAWRLNPVRVCRIHRVALREIQSGKWDDNLHELGGMQEEIMSEIAASHDLPTKGASDLQEYAERRLEGQSGPAWLDGQDIDQAIRATEMLGGLIAFGPKQSAAEMTSEMWDHAGRQAWELVSQGEEAVTAFFTDRIAKSAKSEGRPRPRKVFGMLYNWLSASRLTKDPGPIRGLLREAIFRNVPLMTGQVLLGEPVVHPRLSTVGSIAKAERIHSKTLSNVLTAAGLIDKEAEDDTAAKVVDYWKAQDLIDAAKHAMSIDLAATTLCSSRPIIASLLELGLIRRVQEQTVPCSKLGKAIDGRSVLNLKKQIECEFPLVIEVPEDFDHLAKAAEKSRTKLKVILELLFKGHLQSKFRLRSANGIEAILIRSSEVMSLMESPSQDLPESIRFSIPEA